MITANAAAWREVLARPDAAVRPRPDVWSPLEYACHVRDVFRLYDERLALMLAEDHPRFANWDQDETAVTDRYGAQDPARVADELDDAGAHLASSFAAVQAISGSAGGPAATAPSSPSPRSPGTSSTTPSTTSTT